VIRRHGIGHLADTAVLDLLMPRNAQI